MFGSITGKIAIAQFAVILCLGVFGYFYYTHSQNTMAELNKSIAKLETAVDMQEKTIAAQKEAAQLQNQAMFSLQQNLANAEVTKKNLETQLRKADLQAMARANAVELQTKINQATAQSFKEIEIITTPKDRPVTAPQQPASTASGTVSATTKATTTSNNSPQPPPRPPVRSGNTP
jgi:chromosome segregation ATPase